MSPSKTSLLDSFVQNISLSEALEMRPPKVPIPVCWNQPFASGVIQHTSPGPPHLERKGKFEEFHFSPPRWKVIHFYRHSVFIVCEEFPGSRMNLSLWFPLLNTHFSPLNKHYTVLTKRRACDLQRKGMLLCQASILCFQILHKHIYIKCRASGNVGRFRKLQSANNLCLISF